MRPFHGRLLNVFVTAKETKKKGKEKLRIR